MRCRERRHAGEWTAYPSSRKHLSRRHSGPQSEALSSHSHTTRYAQPMSSSAAYCARSRATVPVIFSFQKEGLVAGHLK